MIDKENEELLRHFIKENELIFPKYQLIDVFKCRYEYKTKSLLEMNVKKIVLGDEETLKYYRDIFAAGFYSAGGKVELFEDEWDNFKHSLQ